MEDAVANQTLPMLGDVRAEHGLARRLALRVALRRLDCADIGFEVQGLADAAPIMLSDGRQAERLAAEAALAGDPNRIDAILLAAARRTDAPFARVVATVFGRAAEHLGALWFDDRSGFDAVTAATAHLTAAARRLNDGPHFGPPEPLSGRRALLVKAPFEAHDFGLVLVGESLRRAGWEADFASNSNAEQVADQLGSETFDALCLGVRTRQRVESAATLIQKARAASWRRNRRPLAVMVGGAAINAEPDLVGELGADAVARDAASAPMRLNALLDLLAAGL